MNRISQYTEYLNRMEWLNDVEIIAMVLGLGVVLFALLGILFALRNLIKTSLLKSGGVADVSILHSTLNTRHPPRLALLVQAASDPDSILEYLDRLSTQTFTDRETILIYEGTAEAAHHVSELVAARFPDVRLTFMPPNSHNISRRKMSLTLGMKAATADIVLTTASNCLIPSDTWLEEMMAPFAQEGVDIVLGYSSMEFDELRGPGRWYRQFDSLVTSSAWIGSALDRRPYRGDGYNLAFRRHLFFDHKGYAGSAYLHYGDDDLFVSEIANRTNTRVVITPASRLTTVWGDAANRIWTDRKEHYAFTQRWLRKGPFLRNALNSWCNWGALLCGAGAIALSVLALEELFPMPGIIALCALCVYWNLEIVVYRRAAAALGAVRLWWAVVPFMLWRPLGNLLFRLRHRSRRYANYTWQRHRSAYIVDYFRQRLRRARRKAASRRSPSRRRK